MLKNMIRGGRRIPAIDKLGKNEINDTINRINSSVSDSYQIPYESSKGSRKVFELILDSDTDNIKVEGLNFQDYHYFVDMYVVNNSGVTAAYFMYCGEDYTPANYSNNRIFRTAGAASVLGADDIAPLIGTVATANEFLAYISVDVSPKGRYYYFTNNGGIDDVIRIVHGHGHTFQPNATSLHFMSTNSATGGNSVLGFGRDTKIQIIQEGS